MATASIELRDRSKDIGKSNKKSQIAALKYWNRVLNQELPASFTIRTWPEVLRAVGDPFQYVLTHDMFGKFADLLMVAPIGRGGSNAAWNTISGYLSKMKNVIINDVSDTRNLAWVQTVQVLFGENSSAGYFTKLVGNLKSELMRRHDAAGTDLVSGAQYMARKHRELVNRELFSKDSTESINARSLHTFQRQAIGRISEAAAFRPDKFQMMEDLTNPATPAQTILVPINRLKNGVIQSFKMYMHRSSWLDCPFHGIATQCAVGDVRTDALFPHINGGNPAQYMNNTLRSLGEELGQYTSHSVKKTAATDAIAHPQINASWVVLRAGWKGDAISTFFTYLAVTAESDGYVGRALSGWRSLDTGGVSPTIDAVPIADRDLFEQYAATICNLGNLSGDVRIALAAVLVLRYNDVKEEFPTCRLIKKMEQTDIVSVEKLQYWSDEIKNWWHLQNRVFVTDGRIAGEMMSEQYSRSLDIVERQQIEQTELMKAMDHKLNSISEQNGRMLEQGDLTHEKLDELKQLLERRSASTSVAASASGTIDGWAGTANRQTIPGGSFPTGLLTSSKGVSMSSVFFRWYDERLYEKEVDMSSLLRDFCRTNSIRSYNEETKPEEVKKVEQAINTQYGKIRRAVQWLRQLCNVTITPRPAAGNITQLLEWQDSLRQLSEDVASRAILFCNTKQRKRKDDGTLPEGPEVKRHRDTFSGLYKGLSMRDIPTPPSIV